MGIYRGDHLICFLHQTNLALVAVKTALASQTHTLETLGAEGGLQLDSSLETGIRFRLNAGALASASFRVLLPNQTMTIKKVDWTHNR
jgi:hypothetical protein